MTKKRSDADDPAIPAGDEPITTPQRPKNEDFRYTGSEEWQGGLEGRDPDRNSIGEIGNPHDTAREIRKPGGDHKEREKPPE